MASVRASERELEPKPVMKHARGTVQGGAVGNEAIKAPLAPLGTLVALRARGSSESTASVDSFSTILSGAQEPSKSLTCDSAAALLRESLCTGTMQNR